MLRDLAEGPIELLRPIPPIALIPFFILLFGLGDEAQVRLIALGAFMIFYIGWLEALRRTPDVLINSARSLGFEGLRLTLFVSVPFAWPAQKPIWRLAVASGLALSVAAEYLGAQGGLGYLIRNARTVLDFSTVAAASLILGVIVVVVDRAAVLAIDLTSSWTRKSERFDG
jgi:ABC-type nitrate/sulfonate/bicarbonate transport system permease component